MAIDIDHLSFSELKALGARVEQRKRQLLIERRDAVRRQLIAAAKAEGYTIQELFDLGSLRKVSQATYANPANPFQTWGGRGKRPRWLVNALASGKTLDDLRVERQ
ncbi:MAG: H-NS family nucleoid-associated regulatory protein [Rehaibacterium terrae]|uniref:H-NS histone family protein n=1 Tax=Rehaibacterium terrae TaxID=1341696 RepID=UPI00391CF21E